MAEIRVTTTFGFRYKDFWVSQDQGQSGMAMVFAIAAGSPHGLPDETRVLWTGGTVEAAQAAVDVYLESGQWPAAELPADPEGQR